MSTSRTKKYYHIKWIADSAGNVGAPSFWHATPGDINLIHQHFFDWLKQYPKIKGQIEECACGCYSQ